MSFPQFFSNFELWAGVFPTLAANLSQEAWETAYTSNFTALALNDSWTCNLEDDLNNVSDALKRNLFWNMPPPPKDKHTRTRARTHTHTHTNLQSLKLLIF